MAVAVIMPRQGQSVESCIITEWHKNVGDAVQEGEPLFTYETDKATFEEPAKAAGTLLARFYNVDDDVPVLVNVAVIGTPGEDISAFAGSAPAQAAVPAAEAASAPEAAQAAAAATAEASPTANNGAPVSPRARAAAERMNLDAQYAAPTGPHGRVLERDVIALAASGAHFAPPAEAGLVTVEHGAIAAAPRGPILAQATIGGGVIATPGGDYAYTLNASGNAPAYEDVKLSNIRKSIAKSMHASLANMAQLTHCSSCDASNILALRKQWKAAPEEMELPNVTINDIVLFAVSRVLLRHRDMNAHFLDDKLRYFRHVNLGFAVDTPRGLLVPTIFNADLKTLREIADEAKSLAKAAQEGSISPDSLTGASFTVSNLGSLGIEQFTPIINPPQTGILGVCTISERVRTVNGQLTAYPAMNLSLTYDHRAVDGAPASRFLQDLCRTLENFSALLIG